MSDEQRARDLAVKHMRDPRERTYPNIDVKAAILEAIRSERANGDARVLAEREACAKVVETFAVTHANWKMRREIAAAIRARGAHD